MAEGQKELLSTGKGMRSASAHVGLEEQCVTVHVFSLLGGKGRRELVLQARS